jgi:hypothetical protein
MSSEHPWIELGEEMGAVIHPGWDGKVPVVQMRFGDTLVTAERVPGPAMGWATRVRAVYVSADAMQFSVRSTGVSSELGKLLFGTQDIIVGDKSFDRRFVVRGSDEARVRALFGRPSVLEALKGYWRMQLTAGPYSRWHDVYPLFQGDLDGVQLLFFLGDGTLSVDRLRRIFGLFREILTELGLVPTGQDDEVERLVARLLQRGGKLAMRHITLWNGDTPRREAAERLGELRAPEAVEPLIDVLADPDDALRLAAVEALEAIGDPAAVPALAGLLADHEQVGSVVIWERAAQAMLSLGAGDLVRAFGDALQGRPTALRDCVYRYRAARPVARALTAVMKGSDLAAVEAAGQALSWLGTAEVLPELRKTERMTGWDRSQKACRKAIAAIEAMPSLPRPADGPEEADSGTLPRVAGDPSPDPEGLPRPVKEAGEEG